MYVYICARTHSHTSYAAAALRAMWMSCLHVFIHNKHLIHKHTYTYVYIYIHTHSHYTLHMYAYTCVYTRIHINTPVHELKGQSHDFTPAVDTYIHKSCIYTCTHAYQFIYIFIYTYKHTCSRTERAES